MEDPTTEAPPDTDKPAVPPYTTPPPYYTTFSGYYTIGPVQVNDDPSAGLGSVKTKAGSKKGKTLVYNLNNQVHIFSTFSNKLHFLKHILMETCLYTFLIFAHFTSLVSFFIKCVCSSETDFGGAMKMAIYV